MSADSLVLSHVISDVIDPFDRSVSLGVLYNDQRPVINGAGFRPSALVYRPRVEVGGTDLRKFYTLVSS